MYRTASLLLLALFVAAPASAQDPEPPPPDVVHLTNGDRVTGVITGFADGALTITSTAMGEVVVPMTEVENVVTGGPITLVTSAGETFQRQVTGLEGGALQFAAAEGQPELASVSVQELAAINPPPKPPVAWEGSINLGASFSTGNTERRAVNAQAEAVRRGEVDRITAKALWSYADEKVATATRNLTERRVQGSLKYDYFVTEKLYTLATALALGDTLADIDLRFTAGAGLGYQWIEEEDIKFATELGLSYFSEDYRSATPSTDTIAVRGAYYLDWQLSEDTQFLQDVEVLPGLETSDDIFLTKDSRIRTSLTDSMFAQAQWIMIYDNTPSPGLERVDHRFLLSLGWSF